MKRLSIPLAVSSAVVACVLTLSLAAPGQGHPDAVSLGNPNDGKLVNGLRLPDRGTGFFSNPHGVNSDAKYGTEELVGSIVKAAADVERWAPGATLVIHDLGFREGGKIPHHQSHQAGRDVDLLFYMHDKAGKIFRPRAVRFDAHGKGVYDGRTPDDPSDDIPVTFDTKRNWILLRSFIENPDAHVQRVFVSEGIRTLLMDHAREAGDPAWIIERAGEAMCEPRVPHDDHYHLRLFCTAEDYQRGCRDAWPIYPWRRTELAGVGLDDVETAIRRPLKRRRRYRRRAPRKTPGRTWCP